jgi:UDP-3-O-[3-hydroxymyristoyl] glucosamine N-acyltransferase
MTELGLSEIARSLDLPVRGGRDASGLRPSLLDGAGPGHISLATTDAYVQRAEEQGVSALLVSRGLQTSLPALESNKPRVDFARLLALFEHMPAPSPGIHPTAVVGEAAQIHPSVHIGPRAVVEDGASIGEGSVVGAGCYVGPGARLGKAVALGPNAVVLRNCQIGDRVRIGAGSVIGEKGFGYEWDGEKHLEVPHLGIVVIEDDVEIGANCAVDRAKTGETRIGRGTKIDNLVQVAHNVRVGKHCLLAGQVGIAGSCVLGDGVIMAGQAGLADSVTLGEGAIIGSQAGVPGDLPGGDVYLGSPARPLKEMRRIFAAMARLPELINRVRALERDRS